MEGGKQEGEHCILRAINLMKFIWNKEELPYQWNKWLCLFTKRVIKLSAVIIEACHCCQLHTKFYPTFFPLS
jgi:hypothetical protein